MKTSHLIAVSISAALAIGAAIGVGVATWQSDSETSTEISSALTSTTSTTGGASSPSSSSIQSPNQAAQSATNGPWNQDLLIATGNSFDNLGETETLVERAGVPSLIERADGSLLAVFQWFPEDNEDAFDRVAVIESEDGGSTWSDPEQIVIEDFPEGYQRPFDPTLALRDDGSVHLYFTTSTSEAPGPNASTIIGVASSSDGVTYTYLGEAFSIDGIRLYDSAVVYWGDMWYMGTPKSETGQYRGVSSDGIAFERGDDVETEGVNWTGNFTNVDDTVYFFGTPSGNGLGSWYATSSDMETWSNPVSLELKLGDPAVCMTSDGNWIVIGVSSPVRSESNPYTN